MHVALVYACWVDKCIRLCNPSPYQNIVITQKVPSCPCLVNIHLYSEATTVLIISHLILGLPVLELGINRLMHYAPLI